MCHTSRRPHRAFRTTPTFVSVLLPLRRRRQPRPHLLLLLPTLFFFVYLFCCCVPVNSSPTFGLLRPTTRATPIMPHANASTSESATPSSTSPTASSTATPTVEAFLKVPREEMLQLPPTLTVLALLPEEHAPWLSAVLRGSQAKWEKSNQTSELGGAPHHRKFSSSAWDGNLGLTVYSEPANNDTERLLATVCEWIQIHQPDVVLSLLDPPRSFYAAMVARSAQVPFVSMSQRYQDGNQQFDQWSLVSF